MKQVRVAILGQGRSGRDIHGFSLTKMPDRYKVIAVVDEVPERRARAEHEYGCSSYGDYHDFIQRDDIDLVINALPSSFHVPVSLELVRAGFNVLCEKPLARRVGDVDKLIETAQQSNRVLAVYQQSRFSPAFMQMRKVIASGVLGRIVHVNISFNGFARRWDWQTLKNKNGGSLLNTGPHPLDQALQLFGMDVMPQLACYMDSANSYGDAEDYVKLVLYGRDRPIIDVEISSCDAYPAFVYRVQGTRGGMTGNTTHLEWKYFDSEEASKQALIKTPLQKSDGTPAYCQETLPWKQDSWDISEDQGKNLFLTMAMSYYSMLYDVLVHGERLKVTLNEVRRQVEVIEEAFRQNPKFNI
ncbi:Gfo/Idh/MocA family oxidoreductase [Alicyclobacillus fastidiosus]|uniref:Gfo/Idh/MocA family oxidoreductase n=1 Tax=Alicyclobacillus fastidiosus TaxID=392011 RepID=A0ABY6ZCJ5_9BACL|nr:Gfo/Idh/MocA family oxidoreductase [Alicyclobacillus fastidiosus]WAH40613.1 Gfo/Idh/MocA family oxidoreductase [Alicyclobacillus fastidiosus]GMA62054.1 oxidoreductase [Alicyclobacillus fastidiosus]